MVLYILSLTSDKEPDDLSKKWVVIHQIYI